MQPITLQVQQSQLMADGQLNNCKDFLFWNGKAGPDFSGPAFYYPRFFGSDLLVITVCLQPWSTDALIDR
jgi:hypothetical protein